MNSSIRIACVALACSMTVESVVCGATYTVTSVLDSGPGTLRQAVLDANANSGADVINFDESVFDGTPTIAFNGEIVISDPLTIEGPPNRVVFSGNLANRMFRIDDGTSSNITVIFKKTRFLFGRVFGGDDGGAIHVANENVQLFDCELHGNESQDIGGAIYVAGGIPSFLTLTRCTATNNKATTAGGVIGIFGICISAINDCSFHFNESGAGGAINHSAGGQLAITGSTFYQNAATGSSAGAIFLNGSIATPTIRNCTFSENEAFTHGGAISLGSSYAANLTLQNCTLTNNSAGTGGGGGSGGAIANPFAGITFNLNSCILWGNTAVTTGPDILTSGTVNATACLVQSTVGITTFGGDPFTFAHLGVNPMLHPLDNNGGLTYTHSLHPSSPAIDNGQNPAGLTTDQRGSGYPRVLDGDCDSIATPDIGSIEMVCCPADLNNDQVVGVPDLLAVINAWGVCFDCPADINDDGIVGVPDLLAVINAWGICD